jgi:hypothetical protein
VELIAALDSWSKRWRRKREKRSRDLLLGEGRCCVVLTEAMPMA